MCGLCISFGRVRAVVAMDLASFCLVASTSWLCGLPAAPGLLLCRAMLFGLRCCPPCSGSALAPVIHLETLMKLLRPYTPIPINTSIAFTIRAFGAVQFPLWVAPGFVCSGLRRMYGSAAFLDHVSRTLPNRRRTARFSSLMCRPPSEAHRYGRYPTHH